MLKSKIHRATITEANIDYEGSITIDSKLMELADIKEYEKVLVAVVETGVRFETYAILGEEYSGVICVNGAAAQLAEPGQKVIIMAFAMIENENVDSFSQSVVRVNENNEPL